MNDTFNYEDAKRDIYALAYEMPRDAKPLFTFNSTAVYKKQFGSLGDACRQLSTLRKELRGELVWYASRVGGQGNTDTLNNITNCVQLIKIIDYNLEQIGY